MNSWEEFSSWWRKKIAGKTRSDELIKRKVAELTGLYCSGRKAIYKSESRFNSILRKQETLYSD
jgi:hypothetical protein